jgi:predicted naringenin-chalcone synthase
MSQDVAAGLVTDFGAEPGRAAGMRALFRRAGVESRSSVLVDGAGTLGAFYDAAPGPATGARMDVYARAAGGLAARACAEAMARAESPPEAVRHVVTVSCTGFAAPGVDRDLIDALGLPADVTRTHIGFMGCHAAINALRVAAALSAGGERVLVCCVELCTLHLCGGGPGGRVASALFGDGAAAVVVGPGGGGPGIRSTASVMVPGTRDLMSWRVGDHGFEMELSPRVPEVLAEVVPGWVDGWLGGLGLSRDAVGGWAVHPGGPRVLTALSAALGLGEDALVVSREVLRDQGNRSSATMLFILDRMLRGGGPMPMVGLAFGPGLGGEAVLIG